MDYICPTCGDRVKRDLLVLIAHTERHIADAIKKTHPHWVESDGTCRKCLEYYKKQMNPGTEQKDNLERNLP